jgi:hypothetical protein
MQRLGAHADELTAVPEVRREFQRSWFGLPETRRCGVARRLRCRRMRSRCVAGDGRLAASPAGK